MENNKDNSSRNKKEGLRNITINDGYNEYDEFGDTRNKKIIEELVPYDIKHSKNYTDRFRRYKIKVKKEINKEKNNKKYSISISDGNNASFTYWLWRKQISSN